MAGPNDPLKVLVVGCGNIAGGFDAQRSATEWPFGHAGAYLRHGGFVLKACVDPDEGQRERFMARWGIAWGAADMGALPPGAFDIVSICSPTAWHAAHLEQALALRPRAIFCEKPLTPSLAESHRWVQACAVQGVALAVNHTRRWAPDVCALAAQLQAGAWGEVRSAVAHYNKGILNNGSHLLDLLVWLLGPLELRWAGAPVVDFWPDDPSIPAVLSTRQGACVHLSTSHAADYALFELQLVTSRGVLAMESGGMHWRLRSAEPSPHFANYRSLAEGSSSAGRYPEALFHAACNLHDHLASGRALASTGQNALAAQQLCETIRQAAYSSTSLPAHLPKILP